MEDNLKQLVDALSTTTVSIDLLPNIILLFKQQTSQSFPSFVLQSFQSLLNLKYWTWQQLSNDYHQWINQPNHITLFQTLAVFNKNLVFDDDNIDEETKASLLIPDTVEEINGIFEQINHTTDDYNPFIAIVNLWIDNLSFFINEYPQFDTSPIIGHINHYIARNYLMTDQFKIYLIQLQQRPITQSIFSPRQLFHLKTCSFSLASYLCANAKNFPFTAEEMLQYVGQEYLQMIVIHTQTLQSWNLELLVCVVHLTGFIHSCCWWGGKKLSETKILFPTEQISCDFAQTLIQISSYEPFHQKLRPKRWNNETIFIDIVFKFILFLLHTQNLTWFFRSNLSFPDILLIIAENSTSDEICLCAYGILGEISTDEELKELKVTDNIALSFSNMLSQGWHQPLKKYKQIPVLQLLIGFLSLTKSDAIQQKIADLDGLPLLIEMSDEYPIVYDILWALSFNQDIQQQLRSSSIFMSKLARLAQDNANEQMRKSTNGILWNLEINHKDHSTANAKAQNTFDIMISYSHKDKIVCKKIYDELVKVGYRVWIDFDQMHGNVMDAMAQAIEQSKIIIICMSEDYRKSNYCRAEAQYAFQRERKIVPVLSQKHYKPDGWLLFLTGQLLYVDFTKYEFGRAMNMLFKELKGTSTVNTVVTEPRQSIDFLLSKLNLLPILPRNLLDWTETHVQSWLNRHKLVQMSQLLADCNGRSLLYLNDYVRRGDINQILNLVQEDSLRRTGQTVSLTELARFRSLMDEQRNDTESDISKRFSGSVTHADDQHCSICCRMM